MSAYLKRLDIASVEEVGVETTGTAYLKRVEIVEVVDSDGNPWEPVPGPDPWDDLIVAQEATWSENNVYAVGETISGTSATFIGGTGNETYRSRVQYKSATDSDWTNTEWEEHLNVPKVISGVVPPGKEGAEVRFKTQAIDLSLEPLAPVNSIAPISTIADPPVVVDGSAWANLNNYVVGEEIYADVANFTGGSDQTITRYRWQTRANNTDNWTSTSWVTYTGAREVFTTATAGYVRLQSQARDDNDDPVTQVNSFTSEQHVLNVGTASVSGTAFAGETVTCSAPTVSGGQQPYTTSYSWSNGAEGQSIALQVADVGNTLTCSVNVHDSAGNHKTFTATGPVGPVGQYTIGTLSPAYDGETYDPNDPPTITQDASFVIWVTQDGTSPNIVYDWEVRSGQARLTPNAGSCTVVNQSAAPGQLAIQVNARDAFANPTGESFRFQFAVITN